jgi:glutamate 5-kinase
VGTVSTRLIQAKRLVVKIGSALLVDPADGSLRRAWLDSLADDVARARDRGQEVIIVSSGTIALGRRRLGLRARSARLEENQAAAAVGQIGLAHAYSEALARHDIDVAQVLLTLGDTEQRRRYLNARSTIETLLRLGVVPVVNENDTVTTDEIRYGDNDRLAARVAQMIGAETLALLSDIDGLYTADPRRDADAVFLPEIDAITDEIAAMAAPAASQDSRGGMVTKIEAARICLGAGCHMVIADGRGEAPLSALEAGARCTWVVAAQTPLTARKQWIRGHLQPAGGLVIDDGAVAALRSGKSLLPAGISSVDGSFERGELVLVLDGAGATVGRGLVAYSADEARRIIGHKSGEIQRLLGYRGREEMVHRDDLVLT